MEENVSDFSAPKVKPLVWEMFDAWTMWSKTVIGTYRISVSRHECSLYDVEFPDGDGKRAIDLYVAKEAAQADYERRIGGIEMTERKWTPGPWVEFDGDICPASNVLNGAIVSTSEDTSDADVHLIAAAPDLYEALQAMIDLQENATPFGGEIYRDRVDRVFDQCRAALAKARGET